LNRGVSKEPQDTVQPAAIAAAPTGWMEGENPRPGKAGAASHNDLLQDAEMEAFPSDRNLP
jgi:hypothetical protein